MPLVESGGLRLTLGSIVGREAVSLTVEEVAVSANPAKRVPLK